ncbi:MAG: MoaD/ThiS family protein [Hyphomicrobium sp.]|jgi:molybdopterin converting factor small subunit
MAAKKENTDTQAPAKVTVVLPRALIDLFPGAPKDVELAADTVRDMIEELNTRWPGMRDRLSDPTPSIRRHLNVFVDGRRANLMTGLRPGSRIYILTAMSGG